MTEGLLSEVPSLYDAHKVLAIQPHYDDNDIAAGGTIAALCKEGVEVVYLTCTDDLTGVIDESWSDEEAAARLKRDQREAGEIIGIRRHYWLGFPDAGEYSHFGLRREIMRIMRIESPDTIITVDPWLAYEAHNDHVMVGKATAEAAILCGATKLKTDPAVDAAYRPHRIARVAFYGTQYPNTCFDISSTVEKKRQAMLCYHAQFHQHELEVLAARVLEYAKGKAQGRGFEYAEMWKVVSSSHLHGFPDTWRC